MENTSPNKQIELFLDNYVKSSNPRYAVMLTGTWGCGKTYFIKRWKRQLEEKITKNGRYSTLMKPIYVSFFGLSSIQEINDAITREVYPIMKSRIYKLGKKALKAVSSVTLRCDLTDSDNDTLEKANIQLDLVSLFRSEYDEEKESRIIIFDDFERCKVPYVDLLGYINQFVEHSNIRVVILCHEEEIKGEEKKDYARFKEKLIGRTFRIEPDTLSVISDFCEQFGLLYLDVEQKLKIEKVFEVVGYNNLRSLYQALLDFSNLGLEYNSDNRQQKEMYERLLIQFVVAYCEYAASEKVRQVATRNTSFKTVFKYYLQDGRLTPEDRIIYSKYRGLAGYHPNGWLFDVPMPYILHSIAVGENISDYLKELMNESEEDKPIEKRISNFSTMENDVFDSTYKEAVEYTLNPFSDVISIIKTVSILLVLDVRKIRPYNGLDDCLRNISAIVANPNNQEKLNQWYDYVKSDINDNKNVNMISFEKSILNELSNRLSILHEKEIHELSQINNVNFEIIVAKYFSIYGSKDETAYTFAPVFHLINPTEFSNALSSLSNNNKLRFGKLVSGRYEKKIPQGSTLYSFFEKEIKNLKAISKQLEVIAMAKTDIDKMAIQELSLAFLIAASKIDAEAYFNRGIKYNKHNNVEDAIVEFTKAIKLNPDYVEAYFNRGVCYDKMDDYGRAIADYTNVIRIRPDYAEAYYKRANNYVVKGDYGRAIADYTKIIMINPTDANVYNRRGYAFGCEHDYDSAIADYTIAIKINPDDAGAYYNRGVNFDNKGDCDKAIADYTEAIRRMPNNTNAYYNRGVCYNNMSDYDKAIADYSEVIRIDSTYADAYYNRGVSYGKKNDNDRAIADYTVAISIKPDYANAYYERAIIFFDNGEYDSAIADYTEVMRINPNNAEAYYNRGVCYDNKGDYDRAIADYTKAIKLNPGDAVAYYNRGVRYEYKGDYDRAIADYTEAISLNPDDDEAYYNRGVCYNNKSDYDRAIEDFSAAIIIKPSMVKAYTDRGVCHYNKGEYDSAIADYTEAMRINPVDAVQYYNRGMCYDNKGDYDKAIADYTEAIRIKPDDVVAYYNRGIAYSNKGDYDQAITDYTYVIRINPNDAEAYYNRGIWYGNKGDYDKAIEDYNKTIKLMPNYAEVYNSYAKALLGKNECEKAISFVNRAIALEPNESDFYDTRCDIYILLKQWNNALNDAKKGLAIARKKGEIYKIGLLKRKQEEIGKKRKAKK